MRLFKRAREKLERIIREEIDEPRERDALEVTVEAEAIARDANARPVRDRGDDAVNS